MAIFDNEAKNYDQWYTTKMGNFVDKVETECAFKLFKGNGIKKVLDVGCGTGNFSIKLAKMGYDVTGVDISDEMLKIAKKKAKKERLNIEFYNMDIYDLSFPSNYFDAVFSMAAFEFIQYPEKAINELFRVTKKGGDILVGTINRDSKWGELYMTKKFRENTVFKYAYFKNLQDLKNLKPKHLIDTGECLFIPPDTPEEHINMLKEKELSTTERGGYICALWRK